MRDPNKNTEAMRRILRGGDGAVAVARVPLQFAISCATVS
jgi:hypothetical protein